MIINCNGNNNNNNNNVIVFIQMCYVCPKKNL